VDPRGNIDEWGAIVKRQGEAFQRETEEKRLRDANAKVEYSNNLSQALQAKQQAL